MPKWEYRVIELGDEIEDGADRVAGYEELMNDLGEAGWELVAVTETEYIDESDEEDLGIPSGTTVAYFKREKF